jgi:two-component system CheB/CheR fusion protein
MMVRQIEDELKATREDLQGTIEELESANEELKASNEEVMSMNEELQSANEELESSKEELQSLNEELNTVNNQLQDKVDELDRANADLTCLLDSSETTTLFLDTALCIKRFTPNIAKVLNLRASDIGRPIGELATLLREDNLLADCHRALEKLTSVERQVQLMSGQSFLQRAFPYRAAGNRIEGLIVTFTDVSQLSEARRLISEHEAYKTVIDHLPVAAMFISGDTVQLNQAAEALTGYRMGELRTPEDSYVALFGAHKDKVVSAPEADKNGPHHVHRLALKRKDGTERAIELYTARVDAIVVIVMLEATNKI